MAVVGKIDKSGVLYISRAGHFVEQVCPHGELKNCSHHCPLFGEPFWNEKYGRVSLQLCGRLVIMFDGFWTNAQILIRNRKHQLTIEFFTRWSIFTKERSLQ